MRASFFEFNVAMSGIFTAKAALNVASHNIANAGNENYSRQVALQRAGQPLTFYDGRGMVGTGSEVYGVGQIRSAYLDQKYWGEKCVLGEYSIKNQLLSLSQTIFDPLSDTGLSASFDSFFNSLKDLQTNSIDDTYRGNVMQIATSLSKFVNNTYESLIKQQLDINDEVSATVQAVNNIGVQIRNLNEQIFKYEMDGSNANDLRDQRAALVDKLSGYVNVQVKEETLIVNGQSQKQFSVQINGNDFVKHIENRTLEVRARTEKANPEDADGLYDIYWARSGSKFDMYHANLSGELKALIDIRDGNNGENFNAISTIERFTANASASPSENDPFKYTLNFFNTGDTIGLDLLKTGDTFVVDNITYKVTNTSDMPNSAEVSISGIEGISAGISDMKAEGAGSDQYIMTMDANSIGSIRVGQTFSILGIEYEIDSISTSGANVTAEFSLVTPPAEGMGIITNPAKQTVTSFTEQDDGLYTIGFSGAIPAYSLYGSITIDGVQYTYDESDLVKDSDGNVRQIKNLALSEDPVINDTVVETVPFSTTIEDVAKLGGNDYTLTFKDPISVEDYNRSPVAINKNFPYTYTMSPIVENGFVVGASLSVATPTMPTQSYATEKGDATITIPADQVDRTDLLQTGKITVVDKGGMPVEYTYNSFVVNEDGSVTFNVTDMTGSKQSKHNSASAGVSVGVSEGGFSNYKGIPYYIARVNDMVRTFARAVNEGLDHNGDPIPDMTGFIDGYDQDGNKNGYLMFTYFDENGQEVTTGPVTDYNKYTAQNFSASAFLSKNPSYVATATTAHDGESNNNLILDFSNMINYKSLFREGTIKDYVSSISTEMAIDLRQAQNFEANYTDVVLSINYQRQSVMSVDVDEETMNIIKYNQLLQTASKLVNVINDMYDTLINGLGA